MNFEFEPRDQELQKQWQQIARELVAPFAGEIDRSGELPEGLLKNFREIGLLKPFLNPEPSVEGRDLFLLTLLLEELARVSPVVALLCAQQVILGIRANLRSFNLPDRNLLAEKAAAFETVISLAASEPESGSDLKSLRLSCSREPDGRFLLNGSKAYVNWAKRAGSILVLAKTKEAEGKGFSLFAVPGSANGIEFGDTHQTMGLNGIEASPVQMTQVFLSADRLCGVYGFGFDLYDQIMNEMRVAVGAIAVGLSQEAYDQAAQHAKSRKQFGKAVGSFQSLQWRFADAATRVESARLHVWRGVEQAGQKSSCAVQAAMTKVYATEAAFEVVDFAVQALGSKGYIKGAPVERLFRDSRFLKIGFGTSELLRNLIATAL